MTKEELRKEFESICDTQLHDDLYRPDFEKLFDWFYSKLEEKDKEIERMKYLINAKNEVIDVALEVQDRSDSKVQLLEAKLKAADEVIGMFGIELDKGKINKALEHYKSLKP